MMIDTGLKFYVANHKKTQKYFYLEAKCESGKPHCPVTAPVKDWHKTNKTMGGGETTTKINK